MRTEIRGAVVTHLSRRSFLRSAAALGFGLGAERLFGAETPIAKIGVFTDTHVGFKGTFKRLEQGYRLFKAHQVDRIVNLGDIADRYDPSAYARYVSIRKRVYPERIPETFIWANHDRMNWTGEDDPMHETSFRKVKELLEIPNERYDSFSAAGYTFLVFPQWLDYPRYEKMIADACAADPGRPVFVLDHVPPITPQEGTVLGGDMRRTNVLSKYPQVISLSGHVHGTLAHEGKIWQGAFTAINFGNLKQQVWEAPYYVAILELHADRMVVRRYAVDTGEELDAAHPWTVTWPFDAKAAPYRFEVRRVAEPTLVFSAAAAIQLSSGGDDLDVEFPASLQSDRVSHYLVEVQGRTDGGWVRKTLKKVGADYVCRPTTRRSAYSVKIGNGIFTEGERIRVTVVAVGFFGNESAPLVAETCIGKIRPWRVLYSGIPAPAQKDAFLAFHYEKSFPLPTEIWKTVPAGARCRLVMDLTVEQEANRTIGYMIRSADKKMRPLNLSFLPLGNSSFVHEATFRRPRDISDLRLYLSRGGQTKVRFNAFRIEVCPDGDA